MCVCLRIRLTFSKYSVKSSYPGSILLFITISFDICTKFTLHKEQKLCAWDLVPALRQNIASKVAYMATFVGCCDHNWLRTLLYLVHRYGGRTKYYIIVSAKTKQRKLDFVQSARQTHILIVLFFARVAKHLGKDAIIQVLISCASGKSVLIVFKVFF